jgi:hypothetical protein
MAMMKEKRSAGLLSSAGQAAVERDLRAFLQTEAKNTSAELVNYQVWLADRRARSSSAQRGPFELYSMQRACRFFLPLPEGYTYTGLADLLLKHGRFFQPQLLPKSYRLRPPRACFDNAYRLAKKSAGRLRYVEGVAAASLPEESWQPVVHHAWCVDAQDCVVDVTWPSLGLAYFGVVMSLDRVGRTRSRDARPGELVCDHATSVLDDWGRRWPVYKEPFTDPQQLPDSGHGR